MPRNHRHEFALIEIAGLAQPRTPPDPTEIAIVFGDGRPSLGWLVRPEAEWPTLRTTWSGKDFGRGLPPEIVFGELSVAVEGCWAYAELPGATAAYVERLARAAGGKSFRVGDLRKLALAAGRSGPRQFRAANDRAWAEVPLATRAAGDARRHLAFVRAIAETTVA